MIDIRKQDAIQGAADALWLSSFALAAGVCTPFGWAGGLIAVVVSLLFGTVFRVCVTPSFLSVLPVFALAFRFGASQGGAAVLLSGVFAFFLSFLPDSVRERLFSRSVAAGFSISAAFISTALFTTEYFGIGAVGATVPEILRDYVSLGFHPNWRGILYGTIVMVVLITYPRKFKKLSRSLPPPFVALLVTVPLHWLLVPDAAHSPIMEVARQTARWSESGMLSGGYSRDAILLTLCSALSLAILMTVGNDQTATRGLSASSLVCGFFGGVPSLPAVPAARRRASAFTAIPIALAVYLSSSFLRIPVPALAVILIVIGWQQVRWHDARVSFTVRQFPFFLCAAVLPAVIGMHYAVPLLVLLSLLQRRAAPALRRSRNQREFNS